MAAAFRQPELHPRAVNDDPVAQNDAATTVSGVATNIAVRGNDGDIDGNPLDVSRG